MSVPVKGFYALNFNDCLLVPGRVYLYTRAIMGWISLFSVCIQLSQKVFDTEMIIVDKENIRTSDC